MGSDSTTAPEGEDLTHEMLDAGTQALWQVNYRVGEQTNYRYAAAMTIEAALRARPAVTPGDAVAPGVRTLVAYPAESDNPPDTSALTRALSMIDALPDEFRPSDNEPLRNCLPGIWPTVKDLRATLDAALDATLDAALSGQQGGAVPAGEDTTIPGFDEDKLWAQASMVSAYALKGYPRNTFVDVLNDDLLKLDVLTHGPFDARLAEQPATAGTGDADRVEGLRAAARDVLAIWDDQRDVPWMIDADKRMEALRAALDGASGQGEGR